MVKWHFQFDDGHFSGLWRSLSVLGWCRRGLGEYCVLCCIRKIFGVCTSMDLRSLWCLVISGNCDILNLPAFLPENTDDLSDFRRL